MNTHQDRPASPALLNEAAEWFIALQGDEVSREQQKTFADWLRRSPVHVEEFLQLTALQGDLTRLPDMQNVDVSALLNEAAQDPPLENVVELSPRVQLAPVVAQGGALTRRRGVRNVLVAAALAAIVIATFAITSLRNIAGTERYDTAVGEQRSLTLADGSRVQLNVRSSLTAKVNEAVRDIHLADGEALFDVAKDPARPFRVRTPQATIEATGTQFNVHVVGEQTIVALLEGRVVVQSSKTASPVVLQPGQQLTIAAGNAQPPTPSAADLRTVTAWVERRLVFEDAPLAEVIAEFNRYSRQPLLVNDPALRDKRITASFVSGSVQTFADTLAAAGGLKVTQQPDGAWLIER